MYLQSYDCDVYIWMHVIQRYKMKKKKKSTESILWSADCHKLTYSISNWIEMVAFHGELAIIFICYCGWACARVERVLVLLPTKYSTHAIKMIKCEPPRKIYVGFEFEWWFVFCECKSIDCINVQLAYRWIDERLRLQGRETNGWYWCAHFYWICLECECRIVVKSEETFVRYICQSWWKIHEKHPFLIQSTQAPEHIHKHFCNFYWFFWTDGLILWFIWQVYRWKITSSMYLCLDKFGAFDGIRFILWIKNNENLYH